MGRDEIVARFRLEMCTFFGFDVDLKPVRPAKTQPVATKKRAHLGPRDFLAFAIEDSVRLDDKRHLINCLGNCKRAIDSQTDRLIRSLGFLPLSRKERWSIPKKFSFVSETGVVAPRILQKVNRLRNRLEHEFAAPSKEQVEDALDIASLFISYAELVRVPTLNWTFSGKLSVRYDYDRMAFHFFETDPDEPTSEAVFSLCFGDDGFKEFYDFLMNDVPMMARENDY
jgi:hypothetical protein